MPMEFLRRSSQSFVLVAVDGLSRAKRLGSFVLAAWVIGKVEKPQSSSKYWRWSRSPKWFRFAMSYRSFSWRTKRQVRCKWECKLSSVLCMGLKSFSFFGAHQRWGKCTSPSWKSWSSENSSRISAQQFSSTGKLLRTSHHMFSICSRRDYTELRQKWAQRWSRD